MVLRVLTRAPTYEDTLLRGTQGCTLLLYVLHEYLHQVWRVVHVVVVPPPSRGQRVIIVHYAYLKRTYGCAQVVLLPVMHC